MKTVLTAYPASSLRGVQSEFIDVASSEFYEDGKYKLAGENKELSREEMADFLEKWVDNYNPKR